MRYTDKVAIVTGAAGGIGAAIAARLGSEGARLILADRTTENGDQHVQAARTAGAPDTAMQACDVSIKDQVAACVTAALDKFGRVDPVVNNAGLMEFKAIEALTEDDWLKSLKVNAVLPGAIDTPMLWDNPNIKSGAEVVSPQDVGKPDQIASAVAFVGSDDASFVTGASLVVDGGRLARL